MPPSPEGKAYEVFPAAIIKKPQRQETRMALCFRRKEGGSPGRRRRMMFPKDPYRERNERRMPLRSPHAYKIPRRCRFPEACRGFPYNWTSESISPAYPHPRPPRGFPAFHIAQLNIFRSPESSGTAGHAVFFFFISGIPGFPAPHSSATHTLQDMI